MRWGSGGGGGSLRGREKKPGEGETRDGEEGDGGEVPAWSGRRRRLRPSQLVWPPALDAALLTRSNVPTHGPNGPLYVDSGEIPSASAVFSVAGF